VQVPEQVAAREYLELFEQAVAAPTVSERPRTIQARHLDQLLLAIAALAMLALAVNSCHIGCSLPGYTGHSYFIDRSWYYHNCYSYCCRNSGSNRIPDYNCHNYRLAQHTD
jgi:hypothetical protein